jgi:hypothetical protein
MPRAPEPRGMHRLGGVALAVLLALAGCSAVPGGGGGGPATESLTPAPIPEQGTSAERLAPGLTREGVTDPLALANAHGAALETDYGFHSNWTARYRNGSVHAHADQRVLVTPAGFTARVTVAGRPGFLTTGPRLTATFWSNGTVLAERIEREDTVGYRYLGAATYNGGAGFYTSLRRPKPWRDHYALFTAVETRVVDEFGGDTGPRRYTVVGERLRDPAVFGAATDVRRPANVSLRAVVTEGGAVRSLRLSYDGTVRNGRRVHVTRSIDYEDDVGQVTRPEWFGVALNGSRDSRGSIPSPRLAG